MALSTLLQLPMSAPVISRSTTSRSRTSSEGKLPG